MRSSSKSTRSKQKSDPKTTAECWVVGAFVFGSLMLYEWLIEREYPDTAIGREGLRQVTNYLEKWLSYGLIMSLFNGSAVIFAGWFDHWFENRHEKVKPKFKPVVSKYVAILVAGLTMFVSLKVCSFEMQTEKNGYKGLRIMKAVSLLIDCQKDLEENKTYTDSITLGKIKGEQYLVSSGGRGSSARYEREYSLFDTEGNMISQISRFDRNRIGEGFSGYISHDVERFSHSGFIASIDGKESDITDDYEHMFTLTVKGDKIVRNVQPFEGDLRMLCYVCEYKGKKEWQICADKSTEFWISTFEGADYYLECITSKGYTRVSNKITI